MSNPSHLLVRQTYAVEYVSCKMRLFENSLQVLQIHTKEKCLFKIHMLTLKRKSRRDVSSEMFGCESYPSLPNMRLLGQAVSVTS